MDADRLARACADTMYANDRASAALGMEIVEVSAGRSLFRAVDLLELVNLVRGVD